jgi:hypothetical protein
VLAPDLQAHSDKSANLINAGYQKASLSAKLQKYYNYSFLDGYLSSSVRGGRKP